MKNTLSVIIVAAARRGLPYLLIGGNALSRRSSIRHPVRTAPDRNRIWEDIREIIRICALDISDMEFREIILRYGGKKALDRIESFPQ